MKNILKSFQIIFLSFVVSSCGYTLRGSLDLPEDVKTISLIAQAYSPTSSEINLLLTAYGVKISNKILPDSFQIRILSERHDKRQLSLSQAGRVNEYELVYNLTYIIGTPLGDEEQNNIILYRDYLFDETRILGTSDREAAIRKEMESNAASMVVNKLKSKIESM